MKANAIPMLGGQGGTIGGSNVAGILGLSPYSNPHSEWLKITGRTEFNGNKATDRGKRLEPIVEILAAEALAPHGSCKTIPKDRETIFHPNEERFTASFDMELHDDQGREIAIVELKTANDRGDWRWGVPVQYSLQGQHYLRAKPQFPRVVFVCFQAHEDILTATRTAEDARKFLDLGVATLHIVWEDRDPRYDEEIVPALTDFHEKYIEADVPPPADGSEACKEAARLYWPERAGQMKMTDGLIYLALALVNAKAEEKIAREKKELAQNQIREILGSHEAAIDEATGAKVSISTRQGREQIDRARLKEEHPEIYEKFKTVSKPYQVVMVRGVV